jgi:lipoate-protein ligase A
MKNLKAFNQFINEELDKEDRVELRSMGFSDYLAPFKERYETLVDEWSSDPEVNAAIDTLKNKFQELFEKHINSESDEDAEAIQRLRELMYETNGIDDIGWFEYIFLNDV